MQPMQHSPVVSCQDGTISFDCVWMADSSGCSRLVDEWVSQSITPSYREPGTSNKSGMYWHYSVRLGGLGLNNPINIAKEQSAGSQKMVERILHQEHHLGDCCAAQKGIKARILSIKHKQQDTEAKNLTIYSPTIDGTVSRENVAYRIAN